MIPSPHRTHGDDLISFVRASPSPYHAVAEGARRLEKAGFRALRETDDWSDATGGCYVVRGGALIAWYALPDAPAHAPFRIVGAHTDSPNLRVKPAPDTSSVGWRQIGVEVYGGVPLNSWLDRDLGISGRLALRDGTSRLVCVDEPLLRVPQLAIHLDRTVNEGLALERQRHTAPIWGLGGTEQGALLSRVADEADVDFYEVLGWDLMLHDVQPPGYLGARQEFLVSARLDNLVSVHAGVTALACAADREPARIPVLAAFDHEEVGSGSESGAQSALLERILRRSVAARGGSREDWHRAVGGTFALSADMTHAVHPNYPERHDPDHRPLPNGGPVVKVNVNQRYATDGRGLAAFAAACEQAGTPWQSFVSNNAIPCGTSIGPLMATRMGISTIDVGVPGLSMHSTRELCGTEDPWLLARTLTEFITADPAV
ncbi:M18 family aminopeptidase [Streptomyces sp. NPDC002889]|uniref:M18 family aminopeptidase n=1 Tax=Streptomyces sp. NPDC002889 TaxID=3364669 RepID=UPI003697489F